MHSCSRYIPHSAFRIPHSAFELATPRFTELSPRRYTGRAKGRSCGIKNWDPYSAPKPNLATQELATPLADVQACSAAHSAIRIPQSAIPPSTNPCPLCCLSTLDSLPPSFACFDPLKGLSLIGLRPTRQANRRPPRVSFHSRVAVSLSSEPVESSKAEVVPWLSGANPRRKTN
jgi:hypothetical protein